jgi:DNA-binding response OmpR family regulator
MRALLVDHDTPTHEPLVRAVRDLCQLEIVASKDLCLERLRAEQFDVAVICDQLSDGPGLELLFLVAQRNPEVMRAFAATPRRLMQVHGKLGRFNVLESIRYPIVPSELRTLLKSAKAIQDANADTSNMQHIVLEGDLMQTESVRMDSRLEIAPEWQPEEAALTQPKPDPKQALEEFVTPQWTVEDSPNSTTLPPSLQSGRTLAPSNKLVAIRSSSTPNERRPIQSVDAALQNKRPLHSVGSDHSKPSARFGISTPQHMAHARAVQAAALAETNTLPPTRPSARRVVIVLTRDKECLDVAVAALAGRAVSVLHASDEDLAVKALRKHGAIAVLADVGLGSGSPRKFLERICAVSGAPVIAVGARATDTLQVAPLLSSGTVQRFLMKPLSRPQTRTTFESVLELPAINDPTVPRESVPFASIIDRVIATDLRSSLKKQPWPVRVKRMVMKYWHWAIGSTVLGVSAMLVLAFMLS